MRHSTTIRPCCDAPRAKQKRSTTIPRLRAYGSTASESPVPIHEAGLVDGAGYDAETESFHKRVESHVELAPRDGVRQPLEASAVASYVGGVEDDAFVPEHVLLECAHRSVDGRQVGLLNEHATEDEDGVSGLKG